MVGFDFGSSTDSFLELDVYDSHTLLDTGGFRGKCGDIGLAGFAGVDESTQIARMDISYHPDSDPARAYNFSVDNLEFEGDPAPESPTVVLMAAGLLGIALGRRWKIGSG